MRPRKDYIFNYHKAIGRKILAELGSEALLSGNHPEAIAKLAVYCQYLLNHLAEDRPTIAGKLREANWQVNMLLREAHHYSHSPKKDLFIYLKSLHETRYALLQMAIDLGLLE